MLKGYSWPKPSNNRYSKSEAVRVKIATEPEDIYLGRTRVLIRTQPPPGHITHTRVISQNLLNQGEIIHIGENHPRAVQNLMAVDPYQVLWAVESLQGSIQPGKLSKCGALAKRYEQRGRKGKTNLNPMGTNTNTPIRAINMSSKDHWVIGCQKTTSLQRTKKQPNVPKQNRSITLHHTFVNQHLLLKLRRHCFRVTQTLPHIRRNLVPMRLKPLLHKRTQCHDHLFLLDPMFSGPHELQSNITSEKMPMR